MNMLFVVNQLRHWPFNVPGITVVPAQTYLTAPSYAEGHFAKVLNLCKPDPYQGHGHYVSLLAEAREHQPLPDVKTIRDLQLGNHRACLAEGLDTPAQECLQDVSSDVLEFDVYFGRDPTGRYDLLAQQVFALLRAPLLHVRFEKTNERWHFAGTHALSAGDISSKNRSFVVQAATECCINQGDRRGRKCESGRGKSSIAILYNPDLGQQPSNAQALRNFCKAAGALGMHAEIINRNDEDRLPEFDALFIRDDTTHNPHAYQFSRRATAEGLVVIDDPDSIVKCNNKVYLNELLARHQIPIPKTMIVHRDNVNQIVPTIGLPCILKRPDSTCSLGVAKVESEQQLLAKVNQFLKTSKLIVAQEFLPTEFDWRVVILDGRPLFVCKYFMAPGHWQIIKHDQRDEIEGDTLALPFRSAPEEVVKIALQAANLFGNGLYGVDIKQIGDRYYVIEINDNPNIGEGKEDGVLKGAVYRKVMSVFLKRIQERKHNAWKV